LHEFWLLFARTLERASNINSLQSLLVKQFNKWKHIFKLFLLGVKMKKLLLASVSVMAFASAAANANVQPEKINLQSLIATAMTSVNMADVLPKNDAHIIVKKQSAALLAEETQIALHKNLLAMAKEKNKESTVLVAESE